MSILIGLKEGRAWRGVAQIVTGYHGIKVSPALVRKHALGYCQSRKIMMALGLRELEVTVPVSMVRKTKPRKTTRKRIRFIIEDKFGVLAVNVDARRGKMSRYDYLLMKVTEDDGVGEVV